MSRYGKNEAARDTGATPKEVSGAWHAAREDAAGSGQLPERNIGKVSDSEHGPTLQKIFDAAGMTGKGKTDGAIGNSKGSK